MSFYKAEKKFKHNYLKCTLTILQSALLKVYSNQETVMIVIKCTQVAFYFININIIKLIIHFTSNYTLFNYYVTNKETLKPWTLNLVYKYSFYLFFIYF